MSFDPAEILKRADDNNNGIIDTNEVSNRNRMFIERAAERAKLDMTKPMPIDKLQPAMKANFDDYQKQMAAGGGRGGPVAPPSSSSSNSSTPRPAGGFGTPPTPTATSSGFSAPSNRAGSIVSLEARFDQSVIDYVNGELLRKYDKNGDGNLDSVEWKANTWSKPPEDSDLNKDGKLSREELCIRISKSRNIPIKGETASSSPSGASSSSGPPSGARPSSSSASSPSYGGNSAKATSDKSASTAKKSYRFLTPTERLPKGMPDWFIKNDADGDGQIMMAEFSTSWTEATAADFASKDLDGDGIITPKEAMGGEPTR